MNSIRSKRSWWVTAALAAVLLASVPRAGAGDAASVKPAAPGRGEMTLDLGDGLAMKFVLLPLA